MARRKPRKKASRSRGWPGIYLGAGPGGSRRSRASYDWAALAWVATVFLALAALIWYNLAYPTAPPPTLNVP